MPTEVSFRGRGRCPVSLLTMKRRANRMLRKLRRNHMQLSVLLCDDPFIRRLNRRYRGIDRVTDVLSFSMSEGRRLPFPSPLLGDVVISLPRASRQAASRRVGLLDEVTELLAHGLLHLLGVDHANPTSERHMTREAARLVAEAKRPAHRAAKSGSFTAI
jgi:probable rRNA maturation factor